MEINSISELEGSGQKYDLLLKWFGAINDKVVVALSGGVDSAVVALAAQMKLGQKAMAVTANCSHYLGRGIEECYSSSQGIRD